MMRATESGATKYRRCLVMAGGGGRLGVHLGSHAAACEAGFAPDVLLGTCGGALVAALVHAEPDPARRLDFLGGAAMYRFWRSVRTRPTIGVARALAGLASRWSDVRMAPRVADLGQAALFEVTGPWPELHWHAGGVDTVLLGARLELPAAEDGQPRRGRRWLQTVAFGPARAGSLVASAPAATGTGAHAGSAVAPTVEALDQADLTLAEALRISLTDMVYLPPAHATGMRWLGGAVDLMPVELAARLADEVWIDRKDVVSRWALAPAWRAVLGIDARRRQREVDAAAVALRIDHRGLNRALAEPLLGRRVTLTAVGPRLTLKPPLSEADHRRIVQAQFEEGRRRTRNAIEQQR